jgi:glycine/D-amino acid oxidase-like deaminating enzyme
MKKQYDYIIVGAGLAGICLAEKLESEGKSFIVIDGEKHSSTLIAGGMYNPVVLKRFTEIWKAEEQLSIALPFYNQLEAKLGVKIKYELPLYRRFFSVEEQNNWFCASDKPNLEKYLSPKLIKKEINGIVSSFGFGEVLYSGYVNTAALQNSYRDYLQKKKLYKKEIFEYNCLNYSEDDVSYKDLKANYIVFSEGMGMQSNPFFKDLPLDGTKGELLLIKIPNLSIDFILKGDIFLIPIGNDLYKVGATYNWEDKTDIPTEEGKKELLDKLKAIVGLDFEIVDHKAGVRPTVKDRRPLLGRSIESDRIYVLNGLGTRGVLLGPFLAEALYNKIENNIPLEENISIHRYKKFKLKN